MKKTSINLAIDGVAFVAFSQLLSTGILMNFILPPGSGHGATVWNMDRHGWGDVHFWVSVVFLSMIAVHLLLHWKWIVAVVRRLRLPARLSGVRTALGAVGLLLVIAAAAAPLVAPVERDLSRSNSGEDHRDRIGGDGSHRRGGDGSSCEAQSSRLGSQSSCGCGRARHSALDPPHELSQSTHSETR